MSNLSEKLSEKLNSLGYGATVPFKNLQGYLKEEQKFKEVSESLSENEKISIINFVAVKGGGLKRKSKRRKSKRRKSKRRKSKTRRRRR